MPSFYTTIKLSDHCLIFLLHTSCYMSSVVPQAISLDCSQFYTCAFHLRPMKNCENWKPISMSKIFIAISLSQPSECLKYLEIVTHSSKLKSVPTATIMHCLTPPPAKLSHPLLKRISDWWIPPPTSLINNPVDTVATFTSNTMHKHDWF